MKKFIYSILSILFVPTILMLYSYNSGSPGGKTGSQGDGGNTCTDCHAGSANTQSGWITSDIPAEGYSAGETYTITVTGTHSGVVKMGFELTSETPFGNKKGLWVVTDASRTQLANANSAVTQTSGGTSVSGNTSSWSADWTAPVAGTGSIKFNTAVNAANGNGMTSGDQIYTSILNVIEAVILNPEIVSVDPDHGNQDSEGDYLISGSETMWTEGIENIVFKYHDDNLVTLTPQSFNIDSDTEVTVVLAIPVDQQMGVYDVYVDDIMLENGFTVDILDAISNEFETSINIYPNPTQDIVNLDLPEGSEYRIIAIDGRQMSSFKSAETNEFISVSDFEKGIYFVQIKNGGESFTKKFVKN